MADTMVYGLAMQGACSSIGANNATNSSVGLLEWTSFFNWDYVNVYRNGVLNTVHYNDGRGYAFVTGVSGTSYTWTLVFYYGGNVVSGGGRSCTGSIVLCGSLAAENFILSETDTTVNLRGHALQTENVNVDFAFADLSTDGGAWADRKTGTAVGYSTTQFFDYLNLPKNHYYSIRLGNSFNSVEYTCGAGYSATLDFRYIKNLTATALSTTSIKLDWTNYGTHTSNTPQIYSGGTWHDLATLAGNSVTYTVTGLTCWTPYDFRVNTVVAGTNFDGFNTITGITAAPTAPIIQHSSSIYTPFLGLSATTNTDSCVGISRQNWYINGVLQSGYSGNTFIKSGLTYNVLYNVTTTFSGYTGYETAHSTPLLIMLTLNQSIGSGFTSNGTLIIPSGYTVAEYLIVAGGGGGGGDLVDGGGGGGGGGGVLHGRIFNPSGGTYSIIIGSGGTRGLCYKSAGINYYTTAKNGGNSSFSGMTAIGGGYGGNKENVYGRNGGAGGSGGGGGGAAQWNYVEYRTYGGNGTTGQGYNGGGSRQNNQYWTSNVGGAGGGGATAVGASVLNTSVGGAGGAGYTSSIFVTGGTYTFSKGGDGSAGLGVNGVHYGDGGGGCDGSDGTIGKGYGGNGKSGYIYVKLSMGETLTVSPSALTVSNVTSTGMTLNWVNGDSKRYGNKVYEFSGGTWVIVASLLSGTTSYNVTGLSPNTSHTYVISNWSANELFTNNVTQSTLNPTPLNVTGATTNLQNACTWTINDTNFGTAIYPMIRISGNTEWITGTTLAKNATSYTFTGLSFNVAYEVQIVRTSTLGDFISDIYGFSTADFVAPVINGSLTGTTVTLQIVDTNANKEYYEIWREIGNTGYTLFDTIYYTGTTWVETGITTGHTYHYKVRSKLVTDFTPTNYSDYSNVISATIQILYAPTGLTISNVGYTGLTLTWVNNNVSGITGNYVQRIAGVTWTTIATVSSGTTTYNVSGLSPVTTYYFRIVAYNDVQEANSATAQDTTLNPAPYGLTATTITLFYQDLSWSLPTPPFGDYIVVQYRINGSGSAWTNAGTVGYNDTTFRLSGLTMGQDYEVRVVEHDNTFGDYPSASFVLEIPAPNFPLAFCEANAYAISGSTCGNADGQIQITNQEYLLYYDFGLTDVFGNVYTLTYDLYTGLTSGYYFLSATAKNEYKWFYGYNACYEQWLEINDSDTPMYLASMKVKPAQCLSFDVSYGRIWFNVSGLTTGNTYTFYAFTSDLSNVDTVTGCTGTTQFLIENAAPTCYYVMIVDEVTGCKLLIANKCVPSIENFSQGGIKRLFIMPWNTNVDYDYWSTAEDDYFLEFEDTSFFLSTKIKQYYSATGGTGYTWYSLPVFPQVCKLEQKLAKVRQGYIFTDTLTLAVNYATAAKWLKMKDVLNPENKWIFVVQDADGYWWTGGYRHGASISTYSFASGARGEDNGYQFVISAISENKLLTAIDENYVNNYILK